MLLNSGHSGSEAADSEYALNNEENGIRSIKYSLQWRPQPGYYTVVAVGFLPGSFSLKGNLVITTTQLYGYYILGPSRVGAK